MRILLVDDDIAVSEALARCFEYDGWEVVIAGGVRVAKGIIPSVDVVVTDYDMPEGGGDAVVAYCVAHDKPVVVLTGNTSVTYRHTVCYKPACFSDVLQAVTSAMFRGQQQ